MTSAGLFSGSDLLFDEASHVYRLPDGRQVPNVTSILKAVGVSTDFEALAAASSLMAEQIEQKRAIGTAVHQDCHAYDDQDLEWTTVNPLVRPYLDAWAVFRENSRTVPLTRERRVFSALGFYCGTLDGLFLTADGKRVLIDIKTGDPNAAAAHLQTAAYMNAFLEEHPSDAIDERWSVRLCPDKKVPYEITNYTARQDGWRDWPKFQACLTVFNEQIGRRTAR